MKNILSTRIIPFSIHFYTAVGGVCGLLALFSASDSAFGWAFLYLGISLFIDCTDGILARKFSISKILPQYDGAMMDNVIDTFTWGFVPLFIIFKLNIVPSLVLTLPMLAICYAYLQKSMKSDDGYFLGFPTLWNIVALYFYLLNPGTILGSCILILFSVLSFVPSRYLYPSKNQSSLKITIILSIIWFVATGLAFYYGLNSTLSLAYSYLSLIFPILYLLASFYEELKIRMNIKLKY